MIFSCYLFSQKTFHCKWDKIFKNGQSKTCGKRSLKFWGGMVCLKQNIPLQIFLKAVFHEFYLIHSTWSNPLSHMFDRLLFKHMYLITGLGSSLFSLVWKVVAAFITWAVSLNLFPAVFSFFLNQFSAWSSIAFWRPCRSLLNPMYCFSIIRTSLSWFFIFDLYIEFDMAVSF